MLQIARWVLRESGGYEMKNLVCPIIYSSNPTKFNMRFLVENYEMAMPRKLRKLSVLFK